MDNRYKLIRAKNPESAEALAQGLSELRQRAVIHAFQQVNVHGYQCFSVAVR